MIRRDGSPDEINPLWDVDQMPEPDDNDFAPDRCDHGLDYDHCDLCMAESEPRADRLDDFNRVRR